MTKIAKFKTLDSVRKVNEKQQLYTEKYDEVKSTEK